MHKRPVRAKKLARKRSIRAKLAQRKKRVCVRAFFAEIFTKIAQKHTKARDRIPVARFFFVRASGSATTNRIEAPHGSPPVGTPFRQLATAPLPVALTATFCAQNSTRCHVFPVYLVIFGIFDAFPRRFGVFSHFRFGKIRVPHRV
ncbi:MAG: hypothetical protein J6U87_03790 [Clostridia bacterium]|nr:hypothetical protein [Clostridia bacterium]